MVLIKNDRVGNQVLIYFQSFQRIKIKIGICENISRLQEPKKKWQNQQVLVSGNRSLRLKRTNVYKRIYTSIRWFMWSMQCIQVVTFIFGKMLRSFKGKFKKLTNNKTCENRSTVKILEKFMKHDWKLYRTTSENYTPPAQFQYGTHPPLLFGHLIATVSEQEILISYFDAVMPKKVSDNIKLRFCVNEFFILFYCPTID